MAATPTAANLAQLEAAAKKFREDYVNTKKQIQKSVVGHEEIIDGVLTCLFAGGHALLEGVPGLGKTLLIRSLSEALHLQFNRIQFTPDLMPADVTGTTIVVENEHGREFQFRKGPIFAQVSSTGALAVRSMVIAVKSAAAAPDAVAPASGARTANK